jgi:hypothetical protein
MMAKVVLNTILNSSRPPTLSREIKTWWLQLMQTGKCGNKAMDASQLDRFHHRARLAELPD